MEGGVGNQHRRVPECRGGKQEKEQDAVPAVGTGIQTYAVVANYVQNFDETNYTYSLTNAFGISGTLIQTNPGVVFNADIASTNFAYYTVQENGYYLVTLSVQYTDNSNTNRFVAGNVQIGSAVSYWQTFPEQSAFFSYPITPPSPRWNPLANQPCPPKCSSCPRRHLVQSP